MPATTPPVPDLGPIDLSQLRQSTLGDVGLEREVLALFAGQAGRLVGLLADLPPEAGALAHKLKGSARAIGARRVAEAARILEMAINDRGAPTQSLAQALADLGEAVSQARAAIETMLRRP